MQYLNMVFVSLRKFLQRLSRQSKKSQNQSLHKLNEFELTEHLLRNLKKKEVQKAMDLKTSNEILFHREVGTSSYIADICISSFENELEEIKNLDSQQVEFTAIEVKVSDWKSGLYQAWRYKSFANRTFLAIYRPYAERVNLKEFENNNIGLIVFDNKNADIVYSPLSNKFNSNTYEENVRKEIWNKVLYAQNVLPVD